MTSYCVHIPLFFIYSSVNGNLGYFYLLVRVKSAAMNTVYKHLFKSSFSILLSVYPEDELLDHTVILFTSLRNCHTTFHSGWTILLSYQQCPMFCFIGCENIYFLRICKILHRPPLPITFSPHRFCSSLKTIDSSWLVAEDGGYSGIEFL